MRTLAQLAGVEYPHRLDQTETGFVEVEAALAKLRKMPNPPLIEIDGAEKLKLSYRARFLEMLDMPPTRVPSHQWKILLSTPDSELPQGAAALYRTYYVELLTWLHSLNPSKYQAEFDLIS